MSEASGAADTAADARHALDEVRIEQPLRLFEQGDPAGFNTVTGTRFQGEILQPLLFESLCDRIREPAATREDAPEIRGVIEYALGESRDVDVAAVKERLQFLKGHGDVHIGLHRFFLHFGFLRGAGTDKDDFGCGVGILDVLGDGRHGGEVMGDEGDKVGEVLPDIVDERRTAGTGQEAFLGEFFGLRLRHHVRTERGFDHGVEAEFFKTRDDLPEFRVGELTGYGGGDHGVSLIGFASAAVHQNVDDIQNIGFIRNGAEGALVDARAARDAFGGVDSRGLLVAHGDRLDLAGVLTRALPADDGGIGTNL